MKKEKNFKKIIEGSKSVESSLKSEKTNPIQNNGGNKTNKTQVGHASHPSSMFSNPKETNQQKSQVFQLHNPFDLGVDVKKSKPGRPKGAGGYVKEYYKSGKKAAQLKRITNKHGVTFTAKEMKDFEREVKKAQKMTKELRNSAAGMLFGMNLQGGIDTKTTDFVLQDKVASLHQMKNREYFNNYMKELKNINATRKLKDGTVQTHVDRQANEMKRRLLLAIDKTMPAETKADKKEIRAIKKQIKEMSVEEFAWRYAEDYFGTLTEFYDENRSISDNLADLKARMNIKYTKEVMDETRFKGKHSALSEKQLEKLEREKANQKGKRAQTAKKGKTPKK